MLLVHSMDVHAVGAENGRVALSRLRAGLRPCLILLDLIMPEMDGLQFREAQLADPELASIPVLVCSVASPDMVVEARKLGLTNVTGALPQWLEIGRAIDKHCGPPSITF